jgi:alkylresorcinol/alkylpyrone synthase
MAKIAGVATSSPAHTINQENIKAFAQKIFGKDLLLDRLMPIFDNAMVEKRHFVTDLEWFGSPHSFTEVNDLYIESALALTEDAVIKLANQCNIKTSDFDVIFFISTTGLSTPSMDARLFNRIKMNPHIKRVPIWGLGCAGGAAGLSRAHDYLKAYPNQRALIVAVELCGLAFQLNDSSKSNLISTALFGDGAAAVLMVGDKVKLPDSTHSHPSTIASYSTIYPDSLDVMSWRITSEGFKVQLSKNIPAIVTSLVKKDVSEFLQELELSLDQINHFIFHPGGMKVLQAYAESLGIPMEKLKHSSEVLRDHGNMSSATVYFVLKRFLETSGDRSQDYGLLGSLGPGFSSELLLLKWD